MSEALAWPQPVPAEACSGVCSGVEPKGDALFVALPCGVFGLELVGAGMGRLERLLRFVTSRDHYFTAIVKFPRLLNNRVFINRYNALSVE